MDINRYEILLSRYHHHFLIVQMMKISRLFAIMGGLIFSGLVLMSLVSVIGRKIGFSPVLGDVEMMQCGSAIALSLFFPYCTLMGEHIKVEFFTDKLPALTIKYLDFISNVVLMMVMVFITIRTAMQIGVSQEYGEVTTLLSLPIWMVFVGLMPGLILMIFCSGIFAHATLKTEKVHV